MTFIKIGYGCCTWIVYVKFNKISCRLWTVVQFSIVQQLAIENSIQNCLACPKANLLERNSSWGVANPQVGLNKAEVYMNCCKWPEERKSHIIIIVANYSSPTNKQQQQKKTNWHEKMSTEYYKSYLKTCRWLYTSRDRNKLTKKGNENVMIGQHGSHRWISIAACAHNKDYNKEHEDNQ